MVHFCTMRLEVSWTLNGAARRILENRHEELLAMSVFQIIATPTPPLDPAYAPCVFSFYNGSAEYPTINMSDGRGL